MPVPPQRRQATIVLTDDVTQIATLDPKSTNLVFDENAGKSATISAVVAIPTTIPFEGVGGTLTAGSLPESTSTVITATSTEEESVATEAAVPSAAAAEKATSTGGIPMGAVIAVFVVVILGCLLLMGFFWSKRRKERRDRAKNARQKNRASSFVGGGGDMHSKTREGPWEDFKGTDSFQEPFPGALPSPSTAYTPTQTTYIETPPRSPRRAPTLKSVKVNPSNNFADSSDDEDSQSTHMPISPTSGHVQFHENPHHRSPFKVDPSHPMPAFPPKPLHRDGPSPVLTPSPKRAMTLRSQKGGGGTISDEKKAKQGNMIALNSIIAALDNHDDEKRSLERTSAETLRNQPHSDAHTHDPFEDPQFVNNLRQAIPKKSS